MKHCHFYTCVVADILLYLKSLDSAQTVEFSRRTSSQSATRHKNMISAHRNMFSVLCEMTVIYKQRKWQRRNTTVGRIDASTKKFLAAQNKTTILLTKLVIVYCLLVSRIQIIRILLNNSQVLLFEIILLRDTEQNIKRNEKREPWKHGQFAGIGMQNVPKNKNLKIFHHYVA